MSTLLENESVENICGDCKVDPVKGLKELKINQIATLHLLYYYTRVYT